VFTLPNLEFEKSEKIKNVFTLGPTAQATVYTSIHDFLSSVSFGLLEKAKKCPKLGGASPI